MGFQGLRAEMGGPMSAPPPSLHCLGIGPHDFLVPSRFFLSFTSFSLPWFSSLLSTPHMLGTSQNPLGRAYHPGRRFQNMAMIPPCGHVPKQIILSRPEPRKQPLFTLPSASRSPYGQSPRPGSNRRQKNQTLSCPGAQGLMA